jgi:8-oxo-dGTP pyrophosphatase MutT (NUDIX family)
MQSFPEIIEALSQALKPLSAVDEADAAVAVLLRLASTGVQVLLVERKIRRSDPWSGQMAFPGGKRDPSDQDIVHTVVRETLEETCINLAHHGRFLGALETMQSTVRPELQVTPFVVLLKKASSIVLNEELEGYLWVSLQEVWNSETVAKLPVGAVPAYVVEGHVVWGLTYRILQSLFRTLTVAGDGSSYP